MTVSTTMRRRGSVLIMALWALLLLSGAIFAWLKFINQNIQGTSERANGLEARALAHSGVMVALNQNVTVLTPLLYQQLAPDREYKVQMTGEGGKINLNSIFQTQDPKDPKLSIFRAYLTRRGMMVEQIDTLIASAIYYLMPGNVHPLGAIVESDTYHPPKRGAFFSADELAQVPGSKPLVSQAGWKDDLTIYGQTPGIDLQSASLRVLESLPGVGEDAAKRFLAYRQGPDRIDGTKDDYIFQSAPAALSFMGVTGAPQQALLSMVYVDSKMTFVHVRSTGRCGNETRVVEVVAIKGSNQPNILSWKEL